MRVFSVLLTFSLLLVVSVTAPAFAGHHKMGEKGDRKERFLKADTDGDGVISRAEFIARAEKRFDKMDADGDGRLSKDELRSAAKRRGQ